MLLMMMIARILRLRSWVLLAWGAVRLCGPAYLMIQVQSGAVSEYEGYAFQSRAFGDHWWAYWGALLWPWGVAAILTVLRIAIDAGNEAHCHED